MFVFAILKSFARFLPVIRKSSFSTRAFLIPAWFQYSDYQCADESPKVYLQLCKCVLMKSCLNN